MEGGSLSIASIAVVLLTLAGTLLAQSGDVGCAASERRIAVADVRRQPRVPFARGERLEYSVSFGRLSVGRGAMEITLDTTEGRTAWRSTFSVNGGFMFLSVHDTNTSWFDTTTFDSFRFAQHLHEPRYHADRDTRISPERRTYQPRDDVPKPSVADPLDEVALVYFIRTLVLEPGECYEFQRYFQPEGNPIVIHVERREQVTVPAGTFSAIVLRPQITTGGIFSQRGRAEVWLSDDSARVVVQLKSQLAFGSINLYLRRISSGASAR